MTQHDETDRRFTVEMNKKKQGISDPASSFCSLEEISKWPA
jgi:hypothetical protein